MIRLGLCIFFFIASPCFSQSLPGLLPAADSDSNYIKKFERNKEVRIFYGAQGNNLSIGSTRDDVTKLNGDIYQNTNDYIGVGITYGWLDGDLSFSLPGTTYLREERSNLSQFKLSFGFTHKKIIFRPYYSESEGVVMSDSYNAFTSEPTLHEVKMGLQVTYLFNPTKYSYGASMYQSEYQVKTAGSFLVRIDPFYRTVGTKNGTIIPPVYDQPSRLGKQTGLQYIRSPGLLVLPGYGINVAVRNTRLFISPIVFAGLGLAQNMYETVNSKGSKTSLEYAANIVLNAGYNGSRFYSKLQFAWSSGYTSLDPSFLTNANITCSLTAGIRFKKLNK